MGEKLHGVSSQILVTARLQMNLFSASILTLTPECILLINKVVAREKKIFKKNTFYSPGYNEKEDNLMLSSPYFFLPPFSRESRAVESRFDMVRRRLLMNEAIMPYRFCKML